MWKYSLDNKETWTVIPRCPSENACKVLVVEEAIKQKKTEATISNDIIIKTIKLCGHCLREIKDDESLKQVNTPSGLHNFHIGCDPILFWDLDKDYYPTGLDKMTQDEFNQVVTEYIEHMKGGEGGTLLHLTNKDLTLVDISDQYFCCAVFENCVFKASDMANSVFEFCKFKRCIISGALLNKAVFRNCDLSYTAFQLTDLVGATFTNCDLGGGMIAQSNLFQCEFIDSNISTIIQEENEGIKSATEFLNSNYEKSEEGYIGYIKEYQWCFKTSSSVGQLLDNPYLADVTANTTVSRRVYTETELKDLKSCEGVVCKVVIPYEYLADVTVPSFNANFVISRYVKVLDKLI